MLKRILSGLFKGRPIDVPNSDRLEEGTARGVTVGDLGAGGTRVVLCRVDGVLHAVDSLCPHEGGHLDTGALVEGRLLRCPLHGYLFDPKDGSVKRGACRKAKLYRVEEKGTHATFWLG